MIIGIVAYRTEIVIEILVVDRTSASPGAGKKRRRRSAAPSYHYLEWRQLITTKN